METRNAGSPRIADGDAETKTKENGQGRFDRDRCRIDVFWGNHAPTTGSDGRRSMSSAHLSRASRSRASAVDAERELVRLPAILPGFLNDIACDDLEFDFPRRFARGALRDFRTCGDYFSACAPHLVFADVNRFSNGAVG